MKLAPSLRLPLLAFGLVVTIVWPAVPTQAVGIGPLAADGLVAAAAAVEPGEHAVTNTPIALNQPADPFINEVTPEPEAAERGMFSQQVSWPIVPIHAVLASNGELTTYGTPTGQAAQGGVAFVDTDLGTLGHSVTTVSNGYNAFCNGLGTTADGEFAMVGGNTVRQVQFYSPLNGGQTSGANLNEERWYASVVRRPDNELLVLGGAASYNTEAFRNPGDNSRVANTPEIGDGRGAWRRLTGATSLSAFGADRNRWWYPRAYNAPDGSVFGVSWNQMWRLDTDGAGSITNTGSLPVNIGASGSSVMYDTGKILFAGGGQAANGEAVNGTNAAAVVDINGGSPQAARVNSMAFARNWLNLTVMANGEVLANGGTRIAADADATNQAEIWNPTTGDWRAGDTASRIRTYHSTALLLPSGAVFTGGGGVPGPQDNFNAEWYLPPYLFERQGAEVTWASRPEISSIAGDLRWGGSIDLGLSDGRSIASASLISLGNVTHSYNSDQRRIPLPISSDGASVRATIPSSVDVLPPGSYLLQVVDSNGVPSPSQIITLALDEPGSVLVVAESSISPQATATTSYVSPWESLAAVNDDLVGASSTDRTFPIYGNWDGPAANKLHWVELEWPQAQTLDSIGVYWFVDGGGLLLPTTAFVEYWDGSDWVRVADIGTAANTFNDLSLNGITTTSVRLWMQSGESVGIAEIRVFEGEAPPPPPPPPPPPAAEFAVVGSVAQDDGSPGVGTKVDLFEAIADGVRGTFLASVPVADDGSFRFEVDSADCYILTFVAADGSSFRGSRYLSRDVCVTNDDPQIATDVRLDPDSLPSIGGVVTTPDGAGAPGIAVDLFEQNQAGARAAFVGFTTTGADGRYEFGVPEGCYVVTFIASEGTTIEGSRWHNVDRCVEEGQTITDLDAGIDGQADASLGGTATGPGGVPVEGLKVTLFAVGADGSRSQFLGETFTDETGGYDFALEAGCYWLVFVGDSDNSFASGRYLEASQCLISGQAVTDLDVQVIE